jgi:bacteriocin-like protein
MKTEENKKQEELTDEQLDNVSGGGEVKSYDKSDFPR